jgi:hypothetical protein
MKVKVYLYTAKALNFKRQNLNGVGIHCKIEGRTLTGWFASLNEISMSPIFKALILKLEEEGVSEAQFNIPPNLNDLLKVIKSSDINKTVNIITNLEMEASTKQDLLSICDVIAHTSIVCSAVKYSVDKDDFNGDVLADAACDCGMTQYGFGAKDLVVNVVDVKATNKKVSSLHPMLFDNNLVDLGKELPAYFSGNGDMTKRAPKKDRSKDTTRREASHVYFTGNNERLRNYGMYSALERYHVLIPTERDSYIDNLVEFQRKVIQSLQNHTTGSVIRLRESSGPNVNSYISKGDYTRIGISLEGDMYSNSNKRADMSYVFNPPRMFYKVKANYMSAYERLMGIVLALEEGTFKDNHLHHPDTNTYLTDVTPLFYIHKDDKTFMCDDRNVKEQYVSMSDILYNGGTTSIKLLYQVSIPTYQEFKRLLNYNPKVYVATERSEEHVVKLSLIIKTDLGIIRYNSPEGSIKVLRKASAKARK